MTAMNENEIEKFLSETRYGMLTTLKADGRPSSVPVWFEWDGRVVRLFTGKDTAKVRHIRRDPRVNLLVANHPEESEAWVLFEGEAAVVPEGGIELAEKLAARYYDLSDPERRAILERWQAKPATFCVIELLPSRIRSYGS